MLGFLTLVMVKRGITRDAFTQKVALLGVLVPLHKLQLHGNARGSYQQVVSLVRIGRICEHAPLRHLNLFQKRTCLSRRLFNADAIIASSISKSAKSVRPTMDRDVISSPIAFAISNSLIQCIVRRGSVDFEHTSVLKLTFQL